MGLVGFLISSGAGGLSIALSTIAIRRELRRRNNKQREESNGLSRVSANESTDASCGPSTAFIKTDTADSASNRGAVVQTHHVTPVTTASSLACASQASYDLYDSEKGNENPLSNMIATGNGLMQDARVIESTDATGKGIAPLKEYTTQASQVTSGSNLWEDTFEGFDFPRVTAVDDDWLINEPGSKTGSCCLANDGFLSEEEKFGAVEDGFITDSQFEMSGFSQASKKSDKRVSFQLGDYVYEHQRFSHGAMGWEKPVAAAINAGNVIERKTDIVSVPLKDDAHVNTGAEARVRSSIPRDENSQNERPVPTVRDIVTETQEASDSDIDREAVLAWVRSDDQKPTKPKRLSVVSIEPLIDIPVLDDVETESPLSMTPLVVREQHHPTSLVTDISSAHEKKQKLYSERESPKALLLPREYSKDSHEYSDEEKENVTSSAASSPERLSRQPRQEIENSGTFRRSSHPALKRFRFSDRIKVRPLRTSGRNSK